MKFSVLWHDCEDDRSGTPIDIEGNTPVKAYLAAIDYIRGLSGYLSKHFSSIDIECLVDSEGKHHYPDIFLGKDKYRIFWDDSARPGPGSGSPFDSSGEFIFEGNEEEVEKRINTMKENGNSTADYEIIE